MCWMPIFMRAGLDAAVCLCDMVKVWLRFLDKKWHLEFAALTQTILHLKYCLDSQTFMHTYHFKYKYLSAPNQLHLSCSRENAVVLHCDLGVLRVA